MGSRDQSVGAPGGEAFKAQVGMAKHLISKRFRGPPASGSQRAPAKRLKVAVLVRGGGSELPQAPASSGGGALNPLGSSDLFPPDAASRSLHVSELMGLDLEDGAGFAEDLDTGAVHSAREVPLSVEDLPRHAPVTEDHLQLALGVGVGSSPDWGLLGSAVRISDDIRGGEVHGSVGHEAPLGPSRSPPRLYRPSGRERIRLALPPRQEMGRRHLPKLPRASGVFLRFPGGRSVRLRWAENLRGWLAPLAPVLLRKFPRLVGGRRRQFRKRVSPVYPWWWRSSWLV